MGTEKKHTGWAGLHPVYFTGFFSLSLQKMNSLIVPFWALELGATPWIIGFSITAGSILPVLFSISSGALVEKLGAKRILLFGSLMILLLAILHPLLSFISAFILLQVLFGQAQSTNWIASQIYAERTYKQKQSRINLGVFNFFVNTGNFIGPLLLGIMWDLTGPWGSFLTIAVWGLVLWLFSLRMPEEDSGEEGKERISLVSLLPKWHDYQKAFSLLRIPIVFLVVYCTFLRLSGFAIQSSFYLVYLNQIAIPASTISFLYSFLSLTSIFSPLCVNFLTRWIDEKRLLVISIIIGIFPLCLTPLFDQIWPFIGIAALSGFGLGLSLPLFMALLSSSVESNEQGLAVGLRITANRLASAFVPFLFGLLVEGIGIHLSFYVIGAVLLIPMMIILPILFRRTNSSL